MNNAQQKPKILNVETVARSRLFHVESVELAFSNGENRVYERLQPRGRKAVMIVPVNGSDILLIREYAVAIEDYELSFPKGAVEPEEDIFTAANRELMEEIGFGARKLTMLAELTMSPSYFSSTMSILLAEDLYSRKLVGDEPEPLTLVPWPKADMMSLLKAKDFNESRNVSALFLAREFLQQRDGLL